MHDIADPVAAAIASGVLAAAAEKGLIVTIGASGSDPESEVRLIESLRRQRARAVILAGSRFTESPAQRWLTDEVAAIQAGGGRVVTIGQDQLHTDAVVVDNVGGARDLAESLWSLGYRRFALLTGPEYLATSEQRVSGFREALLGHGYELPEENLLASQLSRDGGYTAMHGLLEHQLDVDCVFAVDDSMAMGAVAALRDSGLSVPDDIAVAGFGDIAALRDVVPGLTTVRLPLADMGRLAFEPRFRRRGRRPRLHARRRHRGAAGPAPRGRELKPRRSRAAALVQSRCRLAQLARRRLTQPLGPEAHQRGNRGMSSRQPYQDDQQVRVGQLLGQPDAPLDNTAARVRSVSRSRSSNSRRPSRR